MALAFPWDARQARCEPFCEIWSATNFDIRRALVTKYNASFPASDLTLQRRCADGKLPADRCPGNRRWVQIMYDAYLLMPVGPSMLDARNFYLAADQMRAADPTLTWPSNQSELWLAFAKRGFGEKAVSSNGGGDPVGTGTSAPGNDVDPKPSFESLLHPEATVTFTASAPDGGPLAQQQGAPRARIYVGHYEARVSPIADTNSRDGTTTGEDNLDNVARFVAGTYEFVANAPGYGHVRFRRTLTAGATVTHNIAFRTNWASQSQGGVAAGNGAQHDKLIDEVRCCIRSRRARRRTASQRCGSSRSRPAPREAGRTRPTTAACHRSAASHRASRGSSPAPLMHSRASTHDRSRRRSSCASSTCPTGARRTSRSSCSPNQCTGNSQFQDPAGPTSLTDTTLPDQDNDPLNETDCRKGAAPSAPPFFDEAPLNIVPPRDNEVHIAELQVFSTNAGVQPPPEPPPPGPDPPPPPPDVGCEIDDDIVKLGPATAAPGATITYTITYTNIRGDDDDDCEIDDLLPNDLTYVSSTGGGVYDAATRTVSWRLGAVSGGLTKTVSVTATVSPSAGAGSTLVNQAFFSGVDGSPLATSATMVLP